MTEMDIMGVLQHVPQRFPFLLIDRITEFEEGRRIVALKNVTVNEPFFPGHFPYKPIMPGVLILEAMAQAASILAFRTMKTRPTEESVYYYAGIDNARFKRPVVPGDQLLIEIVIIGTKRGFWKFGCTARVDGTVVAEAEIFCAMRPTADPA